ncbi:NirA family protein [Calycomorphotria hydatis]|uniref:Sulfite reductase [ferredoxin] n=1 Tax=Calycomorphotria hydatis TaxID=2528027 RepID=A0A517TA12_9PLAN|nr:NirA family protein [Calycomorphotria hydatis]QDT65199.1 Sulfite reductase [ferredoxin] [Calycomorphotria hydatis]
MTQLTSEVKSTNGSGFSTEQQSYLQGLALGVDVARTIKGLPVLSNGTGSSNGHTVQVGPGGLMPPQTPAGPESIHREAQDRFTAAGKKLCKEELAKRDKDALAMWDEMQENAKKGQFPKGTDVLMYKFSGLFYVAPAQDAYMCRLRFPGGDVKSYQLRGLADMATRLAGGYADVTTRANFQLREISAENGPKVLEELTDLGIIIRGSGADNARNITSSATSGFDPQEFIETLPMAKEMHHFILNHKELYGLPRKFNISFEGGGRIATLEDTNDIGFQAVKVTEGADIKLEPGIYFRLTLGGITGHKDFARYTGVLLRPDECVPVANAILRVFIKNGDRTNRKKARLKYLLDDWGFDKYIEETEKELGYQLTRASEDSYQMPAPPDRWAHVGVHPQSEEGFSYVGVVLPVGRMTPEQMVGIAEIAEQYGKRFVRLTVWQNLIIPHIADSDLDAVKQAIEDLGLEWQASSIRSGLVACTGNAGCKFAGADTKAQAMYLASYLEERVELDVPINIHFTGCHHSCAQHYIGDIGFEGTKVEVGDDMVEGYHMVIGGGYADQQQIGRVLKESLPYEQIPPIVERLINCYLEQRTGRDESFADFARRSSTEELLEALTPVSLGV